MKTLPFPLEAVWACPGMATADIAVYGAAVRILEFYWQSGCRPLPGNDAVLYRHIGCSKQRWHKIKNEVKKSINEALCILPRLYYELSQAAAKRQAKARKGGHISAANRRRKIQLQVGNIPSFSDESSTHARIVAVPSHSHGYNRGTYDSVLRAAAKRNNESGKQMLFTDD